MPTSPIQSHYANVFNLPDRSGAVPGFAQADAGQQELVNTLRHALADFYKKVVVEECENIPSWEEMPSTCFKREDGNPKRATVSYTDKASGNERQCIIESSIETMGNIATKAGQYEALRKHGAQRLDKNEDNSAATRIIPRARPFRIYHLQYGISKETGRKEPAKELLGDGGFAKVRHAYLEDKENGTERNVAVKKFTIDPYSDDPNECINNGENESAIYQHLGPNNYTAEFLDLVHVERDDRIQTMVFFGLLEKGEGNAISGNGEEVLGKIKQLPAAEARKEVRDSAQKYIEIVAFLDEKKVVHPDLELKNLFHESSGEIKALDFGIADKIENADGGFRHANRLKLAKILGKPGLASALESHAMRGNAEAAKDIDSLRAMAKKLLNGEASPKDLLEDDYFKAG